MMKEIAENRKDARPQQTDEDAKYTGLAKHPLARRWLRLKLNEERRAAVEAGPGEKRDRHHRKAKEIRRQLEPGGAS